MKKPQLLPSKHKLGSVEHTREMFQYYDQMAEYWDSRVGQTSDDDFCTRQWNRCCKTRDTFYNMIKLKSPNGSLVL